MKTITTIEEMQQLVSEYKEAGTSISFVPTMGALHAGHISLVERASAISEIVIVSIFVNPTQFGQGEDFGAYPRTIQKDVELLEQQNVAVLFAPNISSMYDDSFSTFIINPNKSTDLCGRTRPEHFQGVLTIVAKLFNIVRPDVAVFGKKDFQQLSLIRSMVRDLNFSLRIEGVDIHREPTGLAMSSRNKYLSPEEQTIAPNLHLALQAAKSVIDSGERHKAVISSAFTSKLGPAFELDYFEMRKPDTLDSAGGDVVTLPLVLLAAARLGPTRLIDNLEINIVEEVLDP